jgi:hypothetical protein
MDLTWHLIDLLTGEPTPTTSTASEGDHHHGN